MTQYVLGFIFNEKLSQFLLLRKDRSPKGSKMVGKLNGIGGKVEDGESRIEAMRRECKEETGLEIKDWTYFMMMYNTHWEKDYEVAVFYTVTDEVYKFQQLENEKLEIFNIEGSGNYQDFNPMSNLRWIVPMAVNHVKGLDSTKLFLIEETEPEPPSLYV